MLDNLDIILLLFVEIAQSVPILQPIYEERGRANLPVIHLRLFGLVLLHHLIKNLLQAIGIRLEGGYDIANCTLDENAVNEAEAFAVCCEGFEGLDD